MAIYRQIQISFWQDELIIELEPEEKYFYLYLMTNDKTTQCGVYRINEKIVAFDTGYSIEKVRELLQVFVAKKRIMYNQEHKELFLLNWLKFNKASSPKVAVVVDRELANIKTIEFHNEVVKQCLLYGYPIKTKEIHYQYPIDTVSKQVGYSIDTETQPEPEEEPKHNNNQKQNQNNAPATNAHLFYQNNFGVANPTVIQTIEHWINDLNEAMVIEAMRRAAVDQKGFRYAEGIMKKWLNKNITTMQQVQADDVAFSNKNEKPNGIYNQEFKRTAEDEERLRRLNDIDLPQGFYDNLI
ncbi:DnaD domain-containing protein [Jeotgalibaca arthritidis]|uniref:DnaD domain protein n=1 Tax=Jeotgalibaca arthritidis TaxID=1868794 RepID=A0A6G7KBI6_9LACT|nr:DnaD domain protein [Jeotgalibaca arthritidis]QII82615.1 DnaD domain protein [Jeotgalibaca arthritidis]